MTNAGKTKGAPASVHVVRWLWQVTGLYKTGVFVTTFVGEIWPHRDLMRKHNCGERDDMYFFDMGKRTDYDDDGQYIGYQGWAAHHSQ